MKYIRWNILSETPFLVRASAWLNTWSCPSVFQLAYCLNNQANEDDLKNKDNLKNEDNLKN